MTPTPNNNKNNKPKAPQNGGGKREISLWEAVRLELKDRIRSLSLGFSIDLEDLIRGIICGVLIVINALLQTTFFVRFAPFGAVPDVMLLLTAAIAASEGEKYGAVCGLFSAFIIGALGGSPGPNLLPLLYAAAGYFIGLLSKNYFSNTLAVKLIYVLFCCLGRASVSLIVSAAVLKATFSQIMTDVVIPEFFSTAVISPLLFVTVWLCYRKFHKSREERTVL